MLCKYNFISKTKNNKNIETPNEEEKEFKKYYLEFERRNVYGVIDRDIIKESLSESILGVIKDVEQNSAYNLKYLKMSQFTFDYIARNTSYVNSNKRMIYIRGFKVLIDNSIDRNQIITYVEDKKSKNKFIFGR